MMRTTNMPNCPVCGCRGNPLHDALTDRLFGVAGSWDMKRCPQSECGLLWLGHMPIKADIHMAYETFTTHTEPEKKLSVTRKLGDAVKNSYLRVRYGYTLGVGSSWCYLLFPLSLLHPGGVAELDALSHYLAAPRQGDRLLEIGCGNGQTLKRLGDLGWQTEGLDVDPVSVNIARSKGLAVTQGELTDSAFTDDSFDVILMNHVLEHIHEPFQFLAECSRILKPSGKMVILTPNGNSLGHRIFGRDWYPLDPPRHLIIYTAASAKRIFSRSPLRPLICGTTVRGARSYPFLSTSLKRLGKVSPHYTGTKLEKVNGIMFQFLERFLLLFKPEVGEELLVIAENNKGTAQMTEGDNYCGTDK